MHEVLPAKQGECQLLAAQGHCLIVGAYKHGCLLVNKKQILHLKRKQIKINQWKTLHLNWEKQMQLASLGGQTR